jgi:two-component system sensor histidine kinase UhpB
VPDLSSATIWSLFVAGALSVGIAVAAIVAALILSQRRRQALQLSYAQQLLAAQDEERARVAREVHDNALQHVAFIRHEIETLRRAGPTAADPDGTRRLDGIASEMSELAITLRTVAHELHPSLIGDVGLPKALVALAADFEREGLEVQLTVPDDEFALPQATALALYRITQEALRNVVKHAGVKAAGVTLAAHAGEIVLTIHDAGRGFAPEPPREQSGLGLTSMRERAGLARGTVHVQSALGQGTTVLVTVPRRT